MITNVCWQVRRNDSKQCQAQFVLYFNGWQTIQYSYIWYCNPSKIQRYTQDYKTENMGCPQQLWMKEGLTLRSMHNNRFGSHASYTPILQGQAL